LTAANARIASLEAKLDASKKAWDIATATKVTAEKTAKSAKTEAKKAEKALVTADQKPTQRDRTVAEHLEKILALFGDKHRVVIFAFFLVLLVADIFSPSLVFVFCAAAEKVGLPLGLRQPDTKDPLMAAMDLLESNWKLVQEFLQLICRVLSQMFVGLWPKKRAEMPVDDLKKLVEAFFTVEDPVLTMKSRSVKWGVEGAIALAQSHGEEVNWEKVSSSRACPLSELLGFFEKAKKYAPGIVSIITPSAASLTSTHTSSTPAASALMPPPSAGADSSAPSTATESAAEVA
jgi:hypothetical protein